MTQPTKGPRLGNSPAHQRLILSNLATQLFQNDSIQTTYTRAKRVRPLVEKLITLAKEGSIHSRRRAARFIRDKSVLHKLFTEIAETFQNTSGGYVRITKTGFRLGDHAELAQIELLQTLKSPKVPREKETEEIDTEAPDTETEAAVADTEMPDTEVSESEVTETEAPETEAPESGSEDVSESPKTDTETSDTEKKDTDNSTPEEESEKTDKIEE
jgi:large subunit ribosomal protein L17